jgi:quinol-cytochrome oxidoreductase complex cytochrome b subunit
MGALRIYNEKSKKTRTNFNKWAALLDSHIVSYPTPINLNYAWSFGSIAGLCLVIQILSGMFLAMHYTPHLDYAFASVEHIMRDVKFGWTLRYLHANTASFFFFVVYAHIFRSLYHGSYAYPRHILWYSGILIFVLIIATAFLGYVLPWGQMSFWGATVITSLFSAIPEIGKTIVTWLWGGYSVDNATLNRFFSLHYMLPFLIAGLIIMHLGLLHAEGSNNPLGTKSNYVNFYSYFYVKDLFVFFILLLTIAVFVNFFPNALGHPVNYMPADCIKTPLHIVPEWYFLPFYAILRSIPHKLGGVLAIVGSIAALFILPMLHTAQSRSSTFRSYYKVGFWVWVASFILLGWVGQIGITDTIVFVGQVLTVIYFALLTVGVVVLGFFENKSLEEKTNLR